LVEGKVPTVRSQDLHQPEPAKLASSSGGGLNSSNFSGNVIGLQPPRQPTPDLDIPIRATSFGTPIPTRPSEEATDRDKKAKLALQTAEAHVKACELAEAEGWYRETIRQSPRSSYAGTASDRLKNLRTAKSAPQSAEPPLAETSPDLNALQLRVLWEAAQQYREAVESGDALRIAECRKSLDSVLKVTKEPAGTSPGVTN
jgi:hypothetical protein